jgi:hypothetical protein
MSVITYPLNNIDYSAEDVEIYNSTRTSGVFASGDNIKVSSVGGMKISISTGLAWIKNSKFSGKSIAVTEEEEIQLDPSDPILKRIDRIVLAFDVAKNKSSIEVRKGDFSSTPVPKPRSTEYSLYELVLADIYIGAGVSSVSEENITDQRTNENLCGIMQDSVTKLLIPTYKADVFAYDWEFDGNLYKQGVAVEGIMSTDSPLVYLDATESNVEDQGAIEDWSSIVGIETEENRIILYSRSYPSNDMRIILKVV